MQNQLRHAATVATATLAVLVAVMPVAAQTAAYKAPRTPDGKPDLQGIWTNNVATPLERPRDLAGKEFFTDEEAAAYEKKLRAQPDTNGDPVADPEVWWEKGKSIALRSDELLQANPPGPGR